MDPPQSSKSAIPATLQSLALDSLLSPQVPSFPSEAISARTRVSMADSELSEVALDDESLEDLHVDDDSFDEHLESNKPSPLDLEPSSHKKSASLTTIHSGRHISLLVNRDETRRSVDGQQKLQEEFSKLQKQNGQEDKSAAAPQTPGLGPGIDWNFWGLVISDYPKFASERSEELAQAIAKGIPSTLRGMLWQLMAASKDPELESTYLKLLKETSPHDKAILRDLGRTFPHHDYFTDGQGIGQENLYNVLKAYSLFDSTVGYVQGLPFVVAILLLHMPDEEAFSLLVRLMQVYDLRGHFEPEMPKLQLRLYQFERLIEEFLPVLHVHFLRQGVKSSMFSSQWFLTMFSYRFPLEICFRIYDNCLASGIEAIFGFGIALLRKNEDLLLNLKFDDILAFLNTKLLDRYKESSCLPALSAVLTLAQIEHAEGEETKEEYRIDEFVNNAISLRITPFILDSYSHEWEDKVRETNKHAVEVDELRNSNRMLSSQVRNLESNLAQLNVEHIELLNALVKQRLRNEEMESELVRYKLLYAEAMHENEDAQSSHRISLNQTLSGSSRGSRGSRAS